MPPPPRQPRAVKVPGYGRLHLMEIHVVARRDRVTGAQPPYAVLERDNWNDYGYYTLFELKVFLDNATTVTVGQVKIARRGMNAEIRSRSSSTDLSSPFTALAPDYVSLGQDYSYYEVLAALPKHVREELLTALQDAVWLEAKEEQFRSEHVWRTSLLRFGSAENALVDARPLLKTTGRRPAKLPAIVEFRTSVGGGPFSVQFHFGHDTYLTSRINAVIGYNGSGKTRLLANLGQVAHADDRKRAAVDFLNTYGEFIGTPPTYAATIMVSYSAFDTFAWPAGAAGATGGEGGEEFFGYSYCGLRRDTATKNSEQVRKQLKSSDDLLNEFVQALARLRVLGRSGVLERALEPLIREPSFALGAPPVGLAAYSDSEAQDYYKSLSTGHKIALSMVMHLALRLQPRSLVLIDEPEAHLHPSLLAAVLQSFTSLLERYDSQAVIATHSPVVLQEIPAFCIAVLRRGADRTRARMPSTETFGENVGLITAHVFHVDSSDTDFHVTLDELARVTDLTEAEKRFPLGLSAEGRSYFLSQRQG